MPATVFSHLSAWLGLRRAWNRLLELGDLFVQRTHHPQVRGGGQGLLGEPKHPD